MRFSFTPSTLIIWLLIGTLWAPAHAQVNPALKPNRSLVSVVEEPPQFPGGMENLAYYMKKNLRYPKAAKKAKLEGSVLVNFIVTDEGRIKDVEYVNSLGLGTDQEAIRLVENMPNWIPAKKDGKPVNTPHNVLVNFSLK